MPDLSHRSNEEELMDDLKSSGEIIDQTLHELEVINKLLGGNYVTLTGIGKLLETTQIDQKTITIADLGCGGGDILKLIAEMGRKKGYKFNLIGFDANEAIVDYARNNCKQYPEISFEAEDIFSSEFKQRKFDIITSTLFTHHFTDQQLIECYQQWHEQAKVGIVINDLHRHWFAYHSIKWLTRLFSKSKMVQYDAPLSVARSFLRRDLQKILIESGLTKFTLKWMWAFRWQLIIPKISD